MLVFAEEGKTREPREQGDNQKQTLEIKPFLRNRDELKLPGDRSRRQALSLMGNPSPPIAPKSPRLDALLHVHVASIQHSNNTL